MGALRVLLDTQVLLWWLVGDLRLSASRRAEIGRDDTRVFVSAATGWELATKYRLGKLPVAERLILELPRLVAEQEFETLAVSLVHALRAGMLPGEHRDPFDRVLAAQALLEGVPIVSADPAFDGFGVERLHP